MKKSIFLFFAAILCSVSAWAFNYGGSNVYYYFANTASWSSVHLYIFNGTWNQDFTLTKIANTNVYYHKWSSAYNNNEGILFRGAADWSHGQTGDIKANYTSHTSWVQNNTTGKTDLSNINRQAKVVAMLSTGGDYTATANANCTATVSGYTVEKGKSTATSKSASTSGSANNASINAAYGSTITYTATAGTGYTFEGFSTSNSKTLPATKYDSGKTATANKYGTTNNSTYYAYFKANQYTVKFDANGGTGSMSDQSHTYSVSQALTPNAFTRAGYTFEGWNTNADGTGTSYTDQQSISNLSSTDGATITLYAQWEEIPANSHNITYTAQAAGWTYGEKPASAEEGATVTFEVNPTTGYTVTVTSSDVSLSNSGNTYTFTMPTTDVAIDVAATENTHDVTISYKCGDQTIQANGTATAVGEITAKEITAPEITGYKFTSWTLGNGITNKSANTTTNPINITTKASGTYTLTANYEKVVTVYFVNSSKWTAVNCHHWVSKDNPAGTAWPGDKLTKTGETVNEFDVYKATFTSEHTMCIFNNNNGSQTDNLDVQDGKYYYLLTKTWYDSLNDIPAPDPLATDVFLAGSMNGWSTNKDEFKKATKDATTASVTLTLDGSKDYTFKVVREGAWTSRKDQDDNKTITETIEGLQFTSDNSKDCKMKTNLAGPYIFTWEISTSKLSITYPTEEVTITHTYTIAGVEALTGSNWNPADNNNDMTDENGDGVYTLTKENVTLAANTSYEYKVARDYEWNDGQYPASGQPNKAISVTEDGLYQVVFTYDPTQQKLNATATKTGDATITHTVQLAGTMNSWTKEDFTVDGTTATLTKSLNAGVYDFKIVEDGNYYGNGGTMTRPNSTDWTFDGSDNAKLFADIAGTYTFTWNLENDKLSVTHPNLEGNYPTIAIKGTMNEWKDDANVSSSVAAGKTSIDITLEEQKTYEFKVRVGATDLGNGGTMDKGNCSDWTFNPNDGNAKITTYAAGTYTFVWEHATQKLSVTYPTGELTTLPKIYLAGAMLGNDDWSAGKQEFTAAADKKTATYTYNFTERDKTYAFKIISNDAWMGNNGKMKRGNSEGWTFNGNDGDASIYMDIPGNYIFTWEYATNKLTVTYPELPKVALRGTMCNGTGDAQWLENNQILLQTMDDQAHAYAKVNLAANKYRFKIVEIVEGDKWLGYKEADQTMTETNNANWQFAEHGNDVFIEIRTAGNYYFVWNYAAQKLTVTYPVTIDEDAADNSKYSGYNSKIADVIVNRAFVNSYWQTITLPFSMNAAQINAMFGANTQVAKLASSEVQSKNNDDFVLNFDFVNTIDAGTPYLIKPANNVAEGAKVEGVVINTNTTNITTDDAWMIAVLDKKTHSNAKDYWLAENGYLYPFNNTEIKALRAYFYFPNISTSSPVRARVAFNENVETEVENITAPEIKAIKVIQNGQLIIIRDGVKYNVQGQKL